jgi:glutamate dehydrogenase (NADP+)
MPNNSDANIMEGKRPWHVKCDVAFPSATENEIHKADAEALLKNGCMVISEGANMPSTRKP